ncbi:MAG: hypothetical protein OHK0048_10380 [Rhodoferax sp.]
MRLRGLWVAALVTLASQAVPALTWGEVQGRVWIGRGLELVVPARLDAADELTDACFRVKLSHGDVLQPGVQVRFDAAVPGVRIRSDTPVDEPLVQLELQSLCGARATRRYVLLADLPPALPVVPSAPATSAVQAAQPAALAPVAAQPKATVAQADAAMPAATSAGPASAPGQPASASPRPPRVNAPKQAKPKGAAATRAKPNLTTREPTSPAQRAGRSVLRLDPLEQFSDRIDHLDSSGVFAPPEDALRQREHMAALEKEVKALKDAATRNGMQIAELQARLQLMQETTVALSWFWAALAGAGVLLLALVAVLWRMRRSRRGDEPAWHAQRSVASDTLVMGGAAESTLPGSLVDEPAPKATPPQTAQPAAGSDPAAERLATPIQEPPAAPATPALPATPPVPSMPSADQPAPIAAALPDADPTNTGSRVQADAVLDVRQQAEFFVSLGQTERALRVLKKFIADSPVPNPVVYLDLLGLYHSLGYKADFRECRKAFQQHFNGVMPDFPAFHIEGQDLLAYPDVLAELQQYWPSRQSLAFLDACIFHDPANPVRPSYDLAAFKDLLMLHALAEALIDDPAAPADAGVPAPQAADVPQATPKPMALPEIDPIQLHAERLLDAPTVRRASPMAAFPPRAPSQAAAEETPSRMLDLDFSTLGEPVGTPPEASDAALNFEPTPNSTWKVVKKP